MSASTTKERAPGATSLLTEYLLEQLPGVAEGMYRALHSLGSNPTPAMCQMVAIQLAGAHRYCLTVADAIQADKDGVSHRRWLVQLFPETLRNGDGESGAST